ncbi:YMGG-like glycine zipper-containing protein [Falsiroseomonas oryziterrae]|uniref:YMGG-like glycine zipper-containing protein n=1 Tax=Falsiroseomonas oryziterrae TaxID=2911368 RepID=UPI001F44C909|nr:YMGG-like glycine zipper-containing protein [Roseomonas sp. NPKOSM-4]
MRRILPVLVLVPALGLGACAQQNPYDPNQRALGGAALGAGAGALIGSVTGSAGRGALIGGALGAVGGALTTPQQPQWGQPQQSQWGQPQWQQPQAQQGGYYDQWGRWVPASQAGYSQGWK